MTKKYQLAVFIGRFEPFHDGHARVIDVALQEADKVLICIGSSFAPRNYRNPWTFSERIDMIANAYGEAQRSRLMFEPIEDTIYNDTKWVENIQHAVEYRGGGATKIALIGHARDHTSFYLNLFPQWESIDVPDVDGLNSTSVRKKYFEEGHISFWMPTNVTEFLERFKQTSDYSDIKEEYEFVAKYKESWKAAPYPPIFVTVDACVVQSGHVLLIQRKARPGKGLWALPGGFLEQNEKVIDGVLRELREETKIKVPAPVLKGNIVAQRVFDDPNRSSRGRTITHAFLIQLPAGKLPLVKGSDDAAVAKWVPIADIRREDLFEDHHDVIQTLIGYLE